MDVKWSTTHPGVFATCDAEGFIDVWDINQDFETPVLRTQKSMIAVNKIAWSIDGKKMAAGILNGEIDIYAVDKEYVNPRPEEFSKFEKSINSLYVGEGELEEMESI